MNYLRLDKRWCNGRWDRLTRSGQRVFGQLEDTVGLQERKK